jgi:hypothetical protein
LQLLTPRGIGCAASTIDFITHAFVRSRFEGPVRPSPAKPRWTLAGLASA